MKFRFENPGYVYGATGFVAILAVLFNAVLAFSSARGMNIGQSHVIAGEFAIVAMASFFIGLKAGSYKNILLPLLFILGMAGTFLTVSLVNESINLKAFRDMILIVVFFMLGGQCRERSIVSVFRFVTAVVVLFMLVEAFSTELYVWLFAPSKYFATTRGIAESIYDESGLYSAALGYEGRFSLNFLSDHRLSSVFLEQVSLGNFAIVLSVFASCFWARIGRADRIFYLITIPLIVMTTSSRMASALCLLIFIGHFVFPLLPRYAHLLYMPVVLLFMLVFFYDPHYAGSLPGDDLSGRLTHSASKFGNLDMQFFTGGTTSQAARAADTGYTYLVLTQTVMGLILFWLFASFCVQPKDYIRKRFLHGSALYIFANLTVSGTSIFSIKTAALVWLMAGFLCYAFSESSRESDGRAVVRG